MLAREQWDKPSFGDFIAWLETKPPDEKYEWMESSRCAGGQYFLSVGKPWYDAALTPLWMVINSLAYYEPRTFGGLLIRALRAKADSNGWVNKMLVHFARYAEASAYGR